MEEEEKEARELIDRLEKLGLEDATIGDMVYEIERLRAVEAHLSSLSSVGLSAAMDNVLATKLGKIANAAGAKGRPDVGDLIDRGLILRRLMEEEGFIIIYKGR